ncbi:phosphoglycerate kinase [Brevirhabdus sp.]|uniref:phosphoglycerate kinase n=1 Tax=Brevirhabdus sp. TaxID=2004514 RepID=UPI004057E9D0
MPWKTLDDIDLDGRRVLLRVDINVPLENGKVTDSTRIERIAPTVADIRARGGRVVLAAHFGRPKGQVVPAMSLRPLVPELERALNAPVRFVDTADMQAARREVEQIPPGEIVLLENLRFHAGEEANDPGFAQALAALADIYCNDAFSAAHRAHASTEGVAHLLPACAGRLMQAELAALERALGRPQRPVAALVGGAKVSTKLELLGNLVGRVDHLIIGGGMANTFLAARGLEIGKSLAELDMLDTAREIERKATAAGCAIHLPTDIVVAREFRANALNETLPADACPADAMILDAGPASVGAIASVLESCRTLIWNGPLGAFEIAPFDAATNAAAIRAGALTQAGGLVSVAGGGDTVAALNHAGAAGQFSYISTAGGAFLEWMEGKTLPGVAALYAD